ncbi:MAG TPA: 2-succinyl-5-enolpyruvyl-6-hydroxy-3-cyclohexene-1-carboxylic-acid synthase [Streptosporangiaceae bacterium]|nr:2-succinyl-5-enolpyruvyl-6-hydroxy-3-cyclohexene-1-carboxylic-acid synthase [Streptosporangiaceae bacterium]
MNPATALARVLVDELRRCGLREAVVAPGSRSTPLAIALYEAQHAARDIRLHVRVDERSAAFLALGLAKASRAPVAVVCTSGTATAHFHAAVIEADESAVPLLVLTADRPPELRGTGANQAIDQIKLYGTAVRWFCEVGVPEGPLPPMARYWRSLAGRAWAQAAGTGGGTAGPVHLNVAFRDPLVPDGPAEAGWDLAGRAGGAPWTRFAAAAGAPASLDLPWTERGVIVCGDGGYDPAPLVQLAETAGWPLLAEPSSQARRGTAALSAYSYLLESPEFLAARRPDVIVSAGRPGLTRGQLAFLRGSVPGWPGPARRHVVLAQGPGRWADPGRSATDVAGAVRLTGVTKAGLPGPGRWLDSWRAADDAAGAAAGLLLDKSDALSEPRLARDVAALLPDGALLWAASSLPVRDLDQQMGARGGLSVLANRGASGIDGLVSCAMGAALAHQAAGGGPAVALLGDLALLHDSPGLAIGPDEPRPDLCLVVVNNDGGGIFSQLEQAALAGPFERIFGTPHGTDIERLAGASGVPYARICAAGELAGALAPGEGLRLVEVRTDRAAGAALRAELSRAAAAAVRGAVS